MKTRWAVLATCSATLSGFILFVLIGQIAAHAAAGTPRTLTQLGSECLLLMSMLSCLIASGLLFARRYAGAARIYAVATIAGYALLPVLIAQHATHGFYPLAMELGIDGTLLLIACWMHLCWRNIRRTIV